MVEQKGFELSAPFLVCQTTAKCSTVRLRDGFGFRRNCQGRTESTSVAAGKIRQFEGWKEWWVGFCEGEREGDLPLAIAWST